MSQVFYMNVVITSVHNMLDKKMPKGPLPGAPVHKMMVKAGEAILTPDKIAKKMAPKMADNVPVKLKAQGISASSTVELVQGALIVIKITINEVDAGSILAKMGDKKPEVAKVGGCIMQCLPPEILAKLQEEVLAKAIASKLAANMGGGMEQQIAEQGITIEAHGVIPSLEGAFLLSTLAKVSA